MSFYNTQYQPVDPRLIAMASQSPLEAIGGSMSAVDSLMAKRRQEALQQRNIESQMGLRDLQTKSLQSEIDFLPTKNKLAEQDAMIKAKQQQAQLGAMNMLSENDQLSRLMQESKAIESGLKPLPMSGLDGLQQSAITPMDKTQVIRNEMLAYGKSPTLELDKLLAKDIKTNYEKGDVIKNQDGTYSRVIFDSSTGGTKKIPSSEAEYAKQQGSGIGKLYKIDAPDGAKWVTAQDAVGQPIYENPTETEQKANTLMETSSFKNKYGSLSIAEQKNIAMQEVNTRPKTYTQAVDRTGSNFSVQNQELPANKVEDNYKNMSADEKSNLRIFQANSPIGKDHINKNTQKSIAVENIRKQADKIFNMTSDQWNKGVGKNMINSFVSSLPDNWNIMSASAKAEALASVKGKSILGNIFFTYLNEVNKGAPSDADMRVMEQIVTGGDSASLDSTQTALRTWINNVERETSEYYSGRYHEINTLMGSREKEALNNINKRVSAQETAPSLPTKTQGGTYKFNVQSTWEKIQARRNQGK